MQESKTRTDKEVRFKEEKKKEEALKKEVAMLKKQVAAYKEKTVAAENDAKVYKKRCNYLENRVDALEK